MMSMTVLQTQKLVCALTQAAEAGLSAALEQVFSFPYIFFYDFFFGKCEI